MWLSVVSMICCFAIAVMLFTPLSRQFVFYQPMAIFFLFEGVWSLVGGFLKITGSSLELMIWLQYIAIFLLSCFMLYMAFARYHKNKKANDERGVSDAKYEAEPDRNQER